MTWNKIQYYRLSCNDYITYLNVIRLYRFFYTRVSFEILFQKVGCLVVKNESYKLFKDHLTLVFHSMQHPFLLSKTVTREPVRCSFSCIYRPCFRTKWTLSKFIRDAEGKIYLKESFIWSTESISWTWGWGLKNIKLFITVL